MCDYKSGKRGKEIRRRPPNATSLSEWLNLTLNFTTGQSCKTERNEILALRVEELRRKLSELQLGTTGLKAELQVRLLTYYGLTTRVSRKRKIMVKMDFQ